MTRFKKKCENCQSCLDFVYLDSFEQFVHCWLCDIWYQQNAEGKLLEVKNPLESEVIMNEPDKEGRILPTSSEGVS